MSDEDMSRPRRRHHRQREEKHNKNTSVSVDSSRDTETIVDTDRHSSRELLQERTQVLDNVLSRDNSQNRDIIINTGHSTSRNEEDEVENTITKTSHKAKKHRKNVTDASKECKDSFDKRSCIVVRQARLCRTQHYQEKCCATCAKYLLHH